MRILVTGGAGFIGSHTIDQLLERGHTIRVLDNLDPQIHPGGARPAYLSTDVELRVGDVRDPDAVAAALRGMDAVLHLAAAVGVGQSMYEIRRYVEVNDVGSATVLEAATRPGSRVSRLVLASSMSIYGEGAYRNRRGELLAPEVRPATQLARREWEVLDPGSGEALAPAPTPEMKALHPPSVYAVSKRTQEELFLAVGRSYGVPATALRYFNTYGPRQALSNPYTGVAAIFASRLLNGRGPMIFEDGAQSRDFIHVTDVARANVLALESDGTDSGVFNVGTGTAVTILEVAAALADALGVGRAPEMDGRYRAGDIRHCFADPARAREELGFRTRVSLADGMADLARWLRDQEADDRVEAARGELERHGLLT